MIYQMTAIQDMGTLCFINTLFTNFLDNKARFFVPIITFFFFCYNRQLTFIGSVAVTCEVMVILFSIYEFFTLQTVFMDPGT
jgi:hypothetical protein